MKRVMMVSLFGSLLVTRFFTPSLQAADNSSPTALQLLRVDPVSGADWVSLESGLTLHFDRRVSATDVRLLIEGDKQGRYSTRVKRTSDPTTLVARANRPFQMDEELTITLEGPEGLSEQWSIHTKPTDLPPGTIEWLDRNEFEEYGYDNNTNWVETLGSDELDETDTAELPLTMPELEIENPGGAADGLIFLQAFDHGASPEVQCHLVLNNEGNLIFYEYFNDRIPFDWQPHDNVGKASYFRYSDRHFYIMDTTWTYIDMLTAGNGYRADPHELRLMEDGSYYLLAFDIRVIDMSEVVEGGDEEAVVTGSIIQHLDADDNVMFEWRSLDHFALTDVDTNRVDLTDSQIDACHMNSIEIDHDENLVVSSRNLSEISKIDRGTGEIIWRFSGSANQFTFLGDEPHPGCGWQHDARILENGNLTIFNNGVHQSDYISSAKEYELDTEEMTAELVWSYQNEFNSIAYAMGSARRQPNGNTLIGWGTARAYRPNNPVASEIDQEGNVVWRIWYNGGATDDLISYRAYRSSMTFRAARPSLAAVWNGQNIELYLNYFGHEDVAGFRTVLRQAGSADSTILESENGRLTLEGYETFEEYEFYTISLDSEGGESDPSTVYTLHINLSDVYDPEASTELPQSIRIHNIWPNPFNASTRVTLTLPRQEDIRVSLVNILGREVALLRDGEMSRGQHSLVVQGDELASGIYFLRVKSSQGLMQSKKLVCIQ